MRIVLDSDVCEKMLNIFVASDLIPNGASLYKDSLIRDDNTQRVLLPYIKTTEQIICKVLKLYDPYAVCNIFPSFDLGVPNNVTRLAGGFATGSIISWDSSVPFVPVDITLNTCSSSYYYIDNSLAKTVSKKLNEKKIIEMTVQGEKQGYMFSFASGNHFIMLAKNKDNQYVLLLHSSNKEYKIGKEALYPTTNSWFAEVKKRYIDSKCGRYLDYLIGESALKFQKIALKNNYKNSEIHSWIASYLCDSNVKPIGTLP